MPQVGMKQYDGLLQYAVDFKYIFSFMVLHEYTT